MATPWTARLIAIAPPLALAACVACVQTVPLHAEVSTHAPQPLFELDHLFIIVAAAMATLFASWRTGLTGGLTVFLVTVTTFQALRSQFIGPSVALGVPLAAFVVIPMLGAAHRSSGGKGKGRVARLPPAGQRAPVQASGSREIEREREMRHRTARALERLAAEQLAAQRHVFATAALRGDETHHRPRREAQDPDETNPRLKPAPGLRDKHAEKTERQRGGQSIVSNPAPVPDDSIPEPDVYFMNCLACNTEFDLKKAAPCDCLTRTRTFVCPHCKQCFCRAPRPVRQKFWMNAPPSLTDRIAPPANDRLPPLPAPESVARPMLLAVEDDPQIHRILQSVCKRLRYGSVHVANGADGLAAARKYAPDLILTDALMPKLDGREMCRILKTDPETARIPVVVMTGLYLGLKYRNEARTFFQADDYLAKPVTIEELASVLRTYLEPARKGNDSPSLDNATEAPSTAPAAVTKTPEPAPEPIPRSKNTRPLFVTCFHCAAPMESKAATLCRCRGDEASVLCLHCLRCSCDAPASVRAAMQASLRLAGRDDLELRVDPTATAAVAAGQSLDECLDETIVLLDHTDDASAAPSVVAAVSDRSGVRSSAGMVASHPTPASALKTVGTTAPSDWENDPFGLEEVTSPGPQQNVESRSTDRTAERTVDPSNATGSQESVEQSAPAVEPALASDKNAATRQAPWSSASPSRPGYSVSFRNRNDPDD